MSGGGWRAWYRRHEINVSIGLFMTAVLAFDAHLYYQYRYGDDEDQKDPIEIAVEYDEKIKERFEMIRRKWSEYMKESAGMDQVRAFLQKRYRRLIGEDDDD